MLVAVLCSEAQRQELGPVSEAVVFTDSPEALAAAAAAADVYIDLLFEEDSQMHLPLLQNLAAGVVIVNSVVGTCAGLPPHSIRINAWPTFLTGAIVELCGGTDSAREKAVSALTLLNKTPEWVPDVPGMVSARITAAIINEAYFTLEEGTATREAIDTAMKLGTAYPFGPFEWAHKIGLQRISSLLHTLSQTENRYAPCTLLLDEAF